MANPEHVEVLKQGVEVWNKWVKEQREADGNFRVDLRGIRLEDELAKQGPLKRYYGKIDMKGVDFSDANLRQAKLAGVSLRGANLRGANLQASNLSDSVFWDTDLSGADLSHADLRRSDFGEADLSFVDFTNSELADTDMYRVSYVQSGLKGKCAHLRGADSIGGNAILRRQMMDQDYVDANWDRAVLRNRRLTFLMLTVWHLFDYGRSWGRVLIFAALLITLFGALYQVNNGTHIAFPLAQESEDVVNGDPRRSWLYPWFVAAIGFCTLGISDLVSPKTEWGQLLILTNVASGFLTLGLLLSVLGNVFARRAD